jgi:threonine aldolase
MTIDNTVAVTANEFRSDTFTIPTPSMVQASISATYGDSVYKEDETTLKLERLMCEISGKEAALFCVSGTMSNQIGTSSAASRSIPSLSNKRRSSPASTWQRIMKARATGAS